MNDLFYFAQLGSAKNPLPLQPYPRTYPVEEATRRRIENQNRRGYHTTFLPAKQQLRQLRPLLNQEYTWLELQPKLATRPNRSGLFLLLLPRDQLFCVEPIKTNMGPGNGTLDTLGISLRELSAGEN
ncbi:uncharacterized protein LOC144327779 [Podarcis muralis]